MESMTSTTYDAFALTTVTVKPGSYTAGSAHGITDAWKNRCVYSRPGIHGRTSNLNELKGCTLSAYTSSTSLSKSNVLRILHQALTHRDPHAS